MEEQRIMSLMEEYKIQSKIFNGLEKDTEFLIQFLGQFPNSKIKKLMIERIEGIVK